jgi:CheY-like chemotaxis protein
MKHILFVDDERNVLSGLRRQLHGLRKEWTMKFVVGGPAAIEALDADTYDVVVTDMQMPMVDGAQVLAHVMHVQPRCARLVLSGHADPDRHRLAASCAHRYLDKPCEPEKLQLEIRDAIAVRESLDDLGDERLERLWCQSRGPSPEFVGVLTGLQASPVVMSPPTREWLETDVVLWALVQDILGHIRPVQSPVQAVEALGARTVLSAVMVAGFLANFRGDRAESGGLEVAAAAYRIARQEGLPDEVQMDAFVAGVLHTQLMADQDPRWLDTLGYLLPTSGFSEHCVIAVTRGSRVQPLEGGAAGIAASLAAACLTCGDPRVEELSGLLESVGWKTDWTAG